MDIKVKVGKPVYLDGLSYNIPLKEAWNQSLLEGLNVIATEIKNAKLASDIFELSVERNDELADFEAQGSIGYVTPVEANKPTGYYYLDFKLMSEDEDENIHKNQNAHIKLNEELNKYLATIDDFQLVKSEYGLHADDEDGLVLLLRAFFVRQASS